MSASTLQLQPDLLGLVSGDTYLAGHGTERHGACPFCGGTDRFWVNIRSNRWFCRQCTPRGGDAISYVMARDRVGYREAVARLGQGSSPPPRPEPPPAPLPTLDWRARAAALASAWQECLWSPEGSKARRWLAQRGLSETTLQGAGLGYCPEDGWRDGWLWWRGVTIPLTGVDGEFYGVRVRRPLPRDVRGQNKYVSLLGSKTPLFGLQGGHTTLLVTEGYFDCLLAYQHAGDLVDVCTMNLGRPSGHWLAYLVGYRRILVCLDADAAGEQGWLRWSWIGTARQVRLPAGKDVTAAVVDHRINLRLWLQEQLTLDATSTAAQFDGTALASAVVAAGRRMWESVNADRSDRDHLVAVFRQHAATWKTWRDSQTGEAAGRALQLDAAVRAQLFAQMPSSQ
jgi:hypothetical protein